MESNVCLRATLPSEMSCWVRFYHQPFVACKKLFSVSSCFWKASQVSFSIMPSLFRLLPSAITLHLEMLLLVSGCCCVQDMLSLQSCVCELWGCEQMAGGFKTKHLVKYLILWGTWPQFFSVIGAILSWIAAQTAYQVRNSASMVRLSHIQNCC